MKKLWVVYVCVLIVGSIIVFAVSSDLNGDGSVTIDDIQILASHFSGKANYNRSYDLNDDSKIDLFDIVALAQQVNASNGNAANYSEYYGNAWNADGLANLEVGKSTGRLVAYRFRAMHTGDINAIRVFFVYRTGYYSGDGGEVQVKLETDDGSSAHVPSGDVLAQGLVTDPMASNFRTIQFNQSVPVTDGQLYHLVFSNPAPDPVDNYVSLDDLYLSANAPNMQPGVSDTNLAVVWKYQSGSSWSVNYGHTPIVGIRYSDGYVQGQGYIDARSSSGAYPITDTLFVRELFTVTGSDKKVANVSVRLRRTSGSGQVIVKLEYGNGTVIEQGNISASSSYDWSTLQFKKSHLLKSGSTYALALSAPAGSQFTTFVMQEGTSQGFQTPNLFTDGRAQYYDGSWHDAISSDMDFQMYFAG